MKWSLDTLPQRVMTLRLRTAKLEDPAPLPSMKPESPFVSLDNCHLMIQHEQKGALDIEISWPFHLKAICFLGGGHPMPLSGKRTAESVTSRRYSTLMLHSECPSSLPFPGSRTILTSTRWLSGPYSSLSNSITRLLKNDENFLFCLLGWEWKELYKMGVLLNLSI